MEKPVPAPAWLHLLNALERDWREAEILKSRNPDAHIEKHLRAAGKWPATIAVGEHS